MKIRFSQFKECCYNIVATCTLIELLIIGKKAHKWLFEWDPLSASKKFKMIQILLREYFKMIYLYVQNNTPSKQKST